MVAICNIVLVGRVSGVNFKQILHKFQPSDKRRRSFTGITIPLPQCTCLLFPNGAVTIVGVKSVSAIKRIPFQLSCVLGGAALVAGIEYDYVPGLRVCNIVGSINAGRRVNLPNLYNSLRHNTLITYTPETFPGMKVSLSGSLVAIVFYSGKVILTGAKTTGELHSGEEKILGMIKQAC